MPDFDIVKKWVSEQEEFKGGQDLSEEDICKMPEVSKLILDSMNELATANKFNGLERIKKVYLHPEPFSEKNDLLTPSQKVKRNVCVKVFRKQIDFMYGM